MEQTANNTIVSLKDIFVRFDGEVILNHINLDIHEKEFVTILGPSGCGKTTTLRIIGGFVEPESGDVIFDGKRINGTPPNKRNVNTVFQKYSLFPHLNVFDNVAFGLKLKKLPKDEIKKKVTKMLATVDLKGYEKRSISKLSIRLIIIPASFQEVSSSVLQLQGHLSATPILFCLTSLWAHLTSNSENVCSSSLRKFSRKPKRHLYMLLTTRKKLLQ